jgi:hypothetical protein
MVTEKIKMGELFSKIGIDETSLKENESIDISDKEIKVKSFNHTTKQEEFKKIKRLMRKPDSEKYLVNGKLEVSKEHRLSARLDKSSEFSSYLEVGLLYSKYNGNFYLFENGNWKTGQIEKTEEKIKVYDLEVEDNHNLFTNGILSHNSYGSPVTTSGGKALKFFASQRIEVAKIESLKKGDNQIGNRVRAKFVKNKVSPPFKIAEFDLMFDGYFNKEGSIIEEAEKIKIVKKSGSWYAYGETRLGQGLDKSSQLLMDNRELCEEIKQKVIQYHREISIEKMTNSSEEGRQRRRAGQSVDQASQVEDSDVETHSSEEE